jgi:EAL domain-containing protein (putative c-di-GMP-specific phosphodiesterase class I)
VETAEQVEIIGRLGCSTMQGYFFAKPIPQSEVESFIATIAYRIIREWSPRPGEIDV